MPKYLTQDEAFTKCKKQGSFIVLEEADAEKIRSTINNEVTKIMVRDWITHYSWSICASLFHGFS